MVNRLRKLWMTDFGKSVTTLVSGSLVAQLIGVISIIVLPRLYNDEAFGVFGFFVATVAIIAVIINGGYENAIMLPEEEPISQKLTALSLWIAAGGSLFLLVILALTGKWILEWGEVPMLYGWHLLIPFSILLEGLSQPYRTLLNRSESYRALSFSKIARSLVLAVVSIGLGLGGKKFEGLILGYLAGQLAGLVVLWVYVRAENKSADQGFSWHKLLEAAGQFSDFPRYSIFSAWLNTASKHLPFYMLIPLYDAGVAGQFNQADRVLTLPVVLVAMSIGTVYYQHASKAHLLGAEVLAAVTRRTFFRLLIPAVPFLVITMIGGPDLFAGVLGEEWRTAGEYARWLMPWMFMVFIASPLSYLIDIKRKLREFLFFNIALFALRLAALWLGGIYLSDIAAMKVYGFSGMVMVGLQLVYLLYIGGVWGNFGRTSLRNRSL
ncbi:MAG: oligosaccharide flippase family protein [Bacteroidia bacterium]|nr:oligosaccharide flippase family protein [Bacteroidia bacterium]